MRLSLLEDFIFWIKAKQIKERYYDLYNSLLKIFTSLLKNNFSDKETYWIKKLKV